MSPQATISSCIDVVAEIARAPLTVSDFKGCTWSRIDPSSQTCKCSVRCPHGAFSAIRSLKMPNDIVVVRKKSKRVLNKAAAAPAPSDCCFDAVRAFNRKCRGFRQRFLQLKDGNRVARKRMLREFVP